MPDGTDQYGIPIKSKIPVSNTDAFGIPIKKKIGDVNGISSSQNVSTQESDFANAQKPTGTISNQQVLDAQRHTQDVGGNNEYTQSVEGAKQAVEERHTQAANNTAALYFKNNPQAISDNNFSLKTIPNKNVLNIKGGDKFSLKNLQHATPFQIKSAQIKTDLDNGDLTTYVTDEGEIRAAKSMTGLKNTVANFKQAWDANKESGKILSMNDEEFKQYASSKPDNEYLPTKPNSESLSGQTGQALPIAIKGTAGSLAGATLAAAAPETAGISTAGLPVLMAWMMTAPEMAKTQAAQGKVKAYKDAIAQGKTPDEAIEIAKSMATANYAEGMALGTLLTELPSFVPKSASTGFMKSYAQHLALLPTAAGAQGLSAGALTDLKDEYAKHLGLNVTDAEKNADFNNSFNGMAGMALAFGVVHGLVSSDGATKAQANNVISKIPADKLHDIQNAEIQRGTLTQEQVDAANKNIADFQSAKKTIIPSGNEEKDVVISGLIQKRKNLEEAKKNVDAAYHPELDAQIESANTRIQLAKNSDNPIRYAETDDLTGQAHFPVKEFEELSRPEKNNIDVPKEFGETVVKPNDNERFSATVEIGGKQEKVEGDFASKESAQKAADDILKQKYYENELPTIEKPESKKKEAEIPISKGVEGSNINNESKSSNESSKTEKGVGEVVQSQQEMWKLTQDESFKQHEDKDTGDGVRTFDEMTDDTLRGIKNGKSGLSIEGKFVVYRDESGKPVGYIHFDKEGAREMGVAKDKRGKGIASQMVDYLKEQKGIDKLLPPFSKEGNAVSHRNEVKKAIEQGKYQEAIANGEMSKERASEIIKSAGLEPTSETTPKESNGEDIQSQPDKVGDTYRVHVGNQELYNGTDKVDEDGYVHFDNEKAATDFADEVQNKTGDFLNVEKVEPTENLKTNSIVEGIKITKKQNEDLLSAVENRLDTIKDDPQSATDFENENSLNTLKDKLSSNNHNYTKDELNWLKEEMGEIIERTRSAQDDPETKKQATSDLSQHLKTKNEIEKAIQSPTENLKTNSIVEDKTEIPKVEDKPIEQKVEDNRVISKQDFHENVLNMAEGMKNSEFEWRVTIPEMSQKDREKAVADIRAGKDSKQAQKLKAFIDDAYDKNTITLNRGRGNQAQTVEYPLKDWFGEPLKNNKLDYAINELDDNSASIIKDENITPENIDNLKHLFNGFPYDKTDFQNIKDYFAGQDKSNAEVGSISTQSEASQAEKIISQTDKEQPIASTSEDEGGSEGNISGVKKDITEPLRSGLNLPKVELPKMGSDTENIHAAKARVDSGESNPLNLVDRILTDKDGFRNENEVFDMQYYGHQLKQQETDLKARYAEAETEQEKAAISGQVQQLSDEVDRFTEASQTALNKWGKIGNAAQVIIDEGFNPSREKLFIKDAYGGEIPKDVNAKIDAIAKERDAALTALKIVEEKLKKVEAEKALNKLKKSADKNKGDIAKLKDEAEELKQQLRQAFKKDLGNINSGIPIPKETLEVLGKLAINYLKQGALTVDAIVNKIYDDLKDEIKEPFTKKDVRDWLINTADIVRETETAKLNRKAEGVENKVIPTILDKKGKPTEQQQFIKPKSQVNTFQNNSEWVKANQRVINAEYKMKVLKRQAFESQKNMFQKGLMWAGRLTRLSVLSGYNVLYKLAAASTIGGGLKRIPEQVIGGVYSKIFKGIAEKAPIEGYFNAKSEAKFYKEFFNPKKFVHNSWEILKTGESDLSKKFSTGKYEHVKGLYLPTDLHQVIKDPLKRATFESSFRNALIHAEKNGLDINDPLIINSIESAAFKRANYEIFQEQNALTKKFNAWKSQLEKSGNVGATGKFVADFLVPVSTVPTNIVRRLVSTSPLGLIRGSAKVIEAYRSGIESLSNEQADAVMRQLKQGSLGTALWLIGWFGYSHYGGLYSKYDPNKTRKEGELASDEMEVNGQQIPKPIQHALPLEIIQWAATARRIYENYSDNKNSGLFESIYNAGMGSIGALTEQIPIVEEVGHLTGAASEPYEAKKLKEDVTRRFEPQILRETGVIKSETTSSSTNPKPLKRQTLKRLTLQKLSR